MSSDERDTRTRILEATWRLLEAHPGQEVKMAEIARAAGISRQAVYLHFASRAELLIATTRYVDEVKGLDARLARLGEATTGVEMLEACVEVWGNYIPEIYAIARALMRAKETDEAAAAAWNGTMGCLRDVCREVIDTLDREDRLAADWSPDEAVDLFFTLISIPNWEQLTIEHGWSTVKYVEHMKLLLRRAFVAG
ncbi:MAG TPA: TetR/AcrR family transcriptional regulator [Gammaproteobacteria bacterium]|nr:TetR/AcrR family transcriptional regulator [Gammaproteobacteria bacterium]